MSSICRLLWFVSIWLTLNKLSSNDFHCIFMSPGIVVCEELELITDWIRYVVEKGRPTTSLLTTNINILCIRCSSHQRKSYFAINLHPPTASLSIYSNYRQFMVQQPSLFGGGSSSSSEMPINHPPTWLDELPATYERCVELISVQRCRRRGGGGIFCEYKLRNEKYAEIAVGCWC